VSETTSPTNAAARGGGARVARLLQLDRGRIRTLLLVAGALFGRPTWTSLALGAAIVVPGAALHLWTKGCLRIGAEVTTSGPYRWTRNPFYLATLIVDVGVAVVAWNPWIAALYFPIWFVVHALTIRREERALSEMFGARYDAYRARVPRLLPWRGRADDLAPSAGFSWSNPQLVAGVEYARLVRTFMAPLLVFVFASAFHVHEGEIVVLWPPLDAPAYASYAALALLVALFVVERALVVRSKRRKARAAA